MRKKVLLGVVIALAALVILSRFTYETYSYSTEEELDPAKSKSTPSQEKIKEIISKPLAPSGQLPKVLEKETGNTNAESFPASCLAHWQQFLTDSLDSVITQLKDGHFQADPLCEAWEKEHFGAEFPDCSKDKDCRYKAPFYRSMIVDTLYPDSIKPQELPDAVLFHKMVARPFNINRMFADAKYMQSIAEEANKRFPELAWPYEIRYYFLDSDKDATLEQYEELTDRLMTFPQSELSVSKLELEKQFSFYSKDNSRLKAYLETLISQETDPARKLYYESELAWENGDRSLSITLMEKSVAISNSEEDKKLLADMRQAPDNLMPFSGKLKFRVNWIEDGFSKE